MTQSIFFSELIEGLFEAKPGAELFNSPTQFRITHCPSRFSDRGRERAATNNFLGELFEIHR
jgi:hypothetical protein